MACMSTTTRTRCAATDGVKDYYGPLLCRPCRDLHWRELCDSQTDDDIRAEDARIARAEAR